MIGPAGFMAAPKEKRMATMTRAITFKLRCVVCSHEWTQRVSAGQDDGPLCPKCLGPSVVRKVMA